MKQWASVGYFLWKWKTTILKVVECLISDFDEIECLILDFDEFGPQFWIFFFCHFLFHLQGNATLHLYPHFKELAKLEGK